MATTENDNLQSSLAIDQDTGKGGAEPERLENPFDLTRLRLSQDFESRVGVKKALITVPVRKPHRQWFVRVHPQPEWRLETAVLEIKEDGETFLVNPDLWSELPGEIVPTVLFTALTRTGEVFLWPVRLPKSDGRILEWHRSALEGAQMAMNGWIRIVANMPLGAYEVFTATGDLPEPTWPSEGFPKLVEIAFRDRYIGTLEHGVIRRLRGEL